MSPSADAASPAIVIDAAAAEKLLKEGETIILAVKPSAWLPLLSSLPVLAVSSLVACVALAADGMTAADGYARFIYLACVAVACVRMMVACGHWMGCLYILTSRRVLSVRGLTKVVIDECPLERIAGTQLSANAGERMLAVATLLFQSHSGAVMETNWPCLANPADVQEAVEQAIRRAG